MEKKKIKILTIFGTRKELIKLYPVLEKLKTDEDFESVVITTSQYREEFDDLCSLFNITPEHDLISSGTKNLFQISLIWPYRSWNRCSNIINRIWFWYRAKAPLLLSEPWPLFITKFRLPITGQGSVHLKKWSLIRRKPTAD